MERRGFLKSFIGGITTAGLVLRASPEEIAAYGAVEGAPVLVTPQALMNAINPGIGGPMLYNSAGQPMAMVTGWTVHTRAIPWHSIDGSSGVEPGIKDIDLDIRSVNCAETERWLRDVSSNYGEAR